MFPAIYNHVLANTRGQFMPDTVTNTCWNRLGITEDSTAGSRSISYRERTDIKTISRRRQRRLMVHAAAVEMTEPRGASRDIKCPCTGYSSSWTTLCLCFKYVHEFRSLQLCLAGRQTPGESWLRSGAGRCSQGHRSDWEVAECINSLLPICSFGQQRQSLQTVGLQMPSTYWCKTIMAKIELGAC